MLQYVWPKFKILTPEMLSLLFNLTKTSGGKSSPKWFSGGFMLI